MEDTIRRALIEAYQQRYGEDWSMNLKKTLRPSPVARIAHELNVPVQLVRNIKQQLWMAGCLVEALQAAEQAPLEETF